MLQSIRDRSQGWIVYTIVGLIILTFALWGVQEYLGLNEQPSVAVVDDVKISQNQYQRALQQQRQRYQSILGANYNPALFDTPAVRRNILEEIINDAVLTQFMASSGMRLSERQIGQLIVDIPQFQQDGKFSDELFNNYLRGQGVDQEGFFYRLGNDIKREQVYQGIVSSGFKTDKERKDQSRLLGQKRELAYMIFDRNDYVDKVDVSDQEVDDYYRANGSRFMTQEKVAVEYIDLSLASLAKQIVVSDKEVRDYYEQNKSLYVAQEQRRASHILFEVSPDADKATEQKVREKAEKVLSKARAGADFAKIAKEYSQDPGSAGKGGDLGYFSTGIMTKPFDEAVFSMKKGEISDLVRSEFGYHIIKLTGIKREEKSFNDVKQQAKRELKQREAEKQYYDLVERMANLAYESVDDLGMVVDETGLNLKTTDLFARSDIPTSLKDKKVVETLFNQDVIANRQNEVVEVTPEHTIVLRIKDHKPAVVKPLETVRSDIVSLLKNNKASEKAKAEAEAALKSIESGQDPEDVARQHHIKWVKKGLVSRADRGKVDATLLQAAFTLPKSDAAVSDTASLRNGDSAVVTVSKVVEGEAEVAKSDEQMERERKEIGALAYNELIEYLKQDTDIVRHYELLQ